MVSGFGRGDRVTLVSSQMALRKAVVKTVRRNGNLVLDMGAAEFEAGGFSRDQYGVTAAVVPRGDRAAIAAARGMIRQRAFVLLKSRDFRECMTVDEIEQEAQAVMTACRAFRQRYDGDTSRDDDRHDAAAIY